MTKTQRVNPTIVSIKSTMYYEIYCVEEVVQT